MWTRFAKAVMSRNFGGEKYVQKTDADRRGHPGQIVHSQVEIWLDVCYNFSMHYSTLQKNNAVPLLCKFIKLRQCTSLYNKYFTH